MIISMEYNDIEGVLVWISQKDSSVAPFSLFISFSLFIFFYFFGGLNGSFYVTLICPLWDLLILSTLGSFPHFRGNTLYITRSTEDLSHFTRYSNHKEDVSIMMYANVCLCQCRRICNDTSASCSND